MSEFQLYALAYALVDGMLLAQEGNLTVTRTTNSQPVSTVIPPFLPPTSR